MRVVMTMRTFNVVSVYAPPPWSTGASILKDTKVFSEGVKSPDGTKVFIWEAIPKDQSFENWTNLYALSAAYPIFGTLDSYFQGSVGQFTSACSDTRVEVFNKFEDTSISFVVLCGSYKNDPKTGEVAFFTMRLKDRTLVKNYYHVRVPSYKVTSSAKTPLPQAEVVALAMRVHSLELTPPVENGQAPGSAPSE